MSEKKNLERLFQEKFKDFEATPSPAVWDNIEAELRKKKKRRVIPLWFRLSGVAAILLIGFVIGDGLINNSSETDNGVVNQEKNNSNNDGTNELVPMKSPVKSNAVVTEAENTDLEKNTSSKNESEGTNATQNRPDKSNALERNYVKNKAVASQDNTDSNNAKKGTIIKNSTNKSLNKFKNQTLKDNNTGLANQEAVNKKNTQGNTSAIANSGNKENSSEKLFNDNTSNKNKALANQENLNGNEKQLASVEKKQNDNVQKNDKTIQNKNLIDKNQNNTSRIAFNTDAFEKQKKDSAAVATVEPNPLEELLKEKEKKQQAVTETKVNRWQITSNVAPIYFSSASNGSPIAQQFADNNKSYDKNLSFGVGVNYALNKKWSVRGGINKLTLGYNTNDIVYYAGLSDVNSRGIMASSNIQESSSAIVIIVEDNTATNLVSFDDVPGKKAGHLNQTMGYVEVPVELSYKLIDNKFGIELIGGMSTLFLNENSLSVVSPGMTTSIGKASNLNDVSFTSNIGIGFKYKFWKSFEANVEPKLKYQINTFSENAGGFKPYFIGLYSGISFNF
ncbi:hypothetical protein MH928_04000 [Flavobacterium sp. WW92]|uniref:outer membrane beta-barrel protein n=1 Tax=unclassified Flavobacterium TaxID=196869 RepID=UPI00222534AB|nr:MULTISPECIES: outer membrane beta-barrel protein [unclassified Flavobacterium]WDO13866.1 hypothetical protein MH928_04000 [Flavobacterium sp. WW92]